MWKKYLHAYCCGIPAIQFNTNSIPKVRNNYSITHSTSSKYNHSSLNISIILKIFSSTMLLHIPHIRHLQELFLLPLFQRAIIDFLAGVFYTAQKASVLVRKACGEPVESIMMLLDVYPKLINEYVPAFFVSHIFKGFVQTRMMRVCTKGQLQVHFHFAPGPVPEFPEGGPEDFLRVVSQEAEVLSELGKASGKVAREPYSGVAGILSPESRPLQEFVQEETAFGLIHRAKQQCVVHIENLFKHPHHIPDAKRFMPKEQIVEYAS